MPPPTIVRSNVMRIEIDGSTIRYGFGRSTSELYEIRGVSMIDRARLKRAGGDDSISASATVQYLTHLYKTSHFNSKGRLAPPARESMASLKPKTSYG